MKPRRYCLFARVRSGLCACSRPHKKVGQLLLTNCATTAVSLWLHCLTTIIVFYIPPKVKTCWSQLIMHVLHSMVKAMWSASFWGSNFIHCAALLISGFMRLCCQWRLENLSNYMYRQLLLLLSFYILIKGILPLFSIICIVCRPCWFCYYDINYWSRRKG